MAYVYITYISTHLLDGIVLGASCIEQVTSNLSSCEEGPLDDRKSTSTTCIYVPSFAHCICLIRSRGYYKCFILLEKEAEI